MSDTRRSTRSAMAVMTPLLSLKEGITNAITDFLKDIFRALVGSLIDFFSGLIKEFLFFPRPSDVSGLESVQEQTMIVFIGLLLIGWLAFLLDLQIFPYSTKSDPYRLLERSFAGMVMVIAGPMVLDYGVVLTSAIGKYFYPSELGSEMTGIIMDNPTGSLIAVLLLLAVGSTLILVVAGFFVILAVRMFLVYLLFALLPLFAAFWIFDTGVGKYTKKTADMFFKATAMILVAGIIIAAILNVGVTVATVDTAAVTGAEAAGSQCLNGMSIGDTCVIEWGQLFAFIGIGGAMTVSTTIAMLGVGSLMGGGGMSSIAGGAVGGLAAGAVGKAKSAAGGVSGGDQQAGGSEPGDAGEPGAAAGGAPAAQLESPDSHGGGGSSGAPRADLSGGAGGGASTVSTQPSGGSGGGSVRTQGGQTGGQGQQQQDKSLLQKTADAADTGSKIGGVVGKVDPAMGAAVTAATGAYKFHKEGGFSDAKQATMDAGQTVSQKVDDVKSSLNSVADPISHRDEASDESGIGEQSSQLDYT